MFKKILKYTALAAVLIASGILLWAWCLYASADLKMPEHAFDDDGSLYFSDSLRTYDGNWLRLGKDGIWEMKVSGNSFERGYAIGQMSSDLLYYQENVFVEQIRRLIPSDSYLKFLRFFIIMFNRNLGENVDEEYRNEIYGISASCTHEFDAIGTPYERQMHRILADLQGKFYGVSLTVDCSVVQGIGDVRKPVFQGCPVGGIERMQFLVDVNEKIAAIGADKSESLRDLRRGQLDHRKIFHFQEEFFRVLSSHVLRFFIDSASLSL